MARWRGTYVEFCGELLGDLGRDEFGGEGEVELGVGRERHGRYYRRGRGGRYV